MHLRPKRFFLRTGLETKIHLSPIITGSSTFLTLQSHSLC
ncbi:hypothetical protein CPC197_1068 [Chlamydia psittaci C1/97]|nr:hypothetical protein CPC197_1068 [Chlamydia psittaci C1/97]